MNFPYYTVGFFPTMTASYGRHVVVTWRAAIPYSKTSFGAFVVACWGASVAAQVNEGADARNSLPEEDRLVGQALLASKNCYASNWVTAEAFGMVDHPACPQKRFGAYRDMQHSSVDAYQVKAQPDVLEVSKVGGWAPV